MDLFDMLPKGDAEKYKPKASDDWKWRFSDYPKSNGINVFSCFACGGGSTMGYKLAGCNVIGCVEIDREMNELYVKNHNPKHNFLMDIREFNKLPGREIPKELFDIDILDGSPPCTTFSTVGKRENGWGKKKKFREGQAEQTLDDLAFVFIETVKKLNPRVVIMENVTGLLIGNAWGYVQKIYQRFGEAGYNVKHFVAKGEEMGVPQTRHRVFFIAIRNDVGVNTNDLNMCFNFAPIPYSKIKSENGTPLNEHTMEYAAVCKSQYCDKSIGDVYERVGEKKRCFSDKLCWDQDVLPTIVASSAHMIRPVEKEYISRSDIIHAQTFPEDYDFGNATYNKIKYVCGMSVPPIMIKRIVGRLIESGVFSSCKKLGGELGW